MDQIGMTIYGKVYVPENAAFEGRSFASIVRPSAKTSDGYHVTCEVILENSDGAIDKIAKRAKIDFLNVVNFENGIEEIELYVGSKLVMIFKPVQC